MVSNHGDTRRVRRESQKAAEGRALLDVPDRHLLYNPETHPDLTTAYTEGVKARAERDFEHSIEYRARLARRIRRRSLTVGIAALVAFGGWSTVGVHHYFAANAAPLSPTWFAAWTVEPFIIAVVSMIIIFRSTIRRAGGHLSATAGVVEFGLLGSSIYMNIAGALAVGQPVQIRVVGPVLAALTAFLLTLFDRACRQADVANGPVSDGAHAQFEQAVSSQVRALMSSGVNALTSKVVSAHEQDREQTVSGAHEHPGGDAHTAGSWTDDDEQAFKQLLGDDTNNGAHGEHPTPGGGAHARRGRKGAHGDREQTANTSAHAHDAHAVSGAHVPREQRVSKSVEVALTEARERYSEAELPPQRTIAADLDISTGSAAKVARTIRRERGEGEQ